MTFPLTPEAAATMYGYVCSLPPFLGLKLPDADDVEFWIIKADKYFAVWEWTGENHRISLSVSSIGSSITLLQALGHEVCHLAVHEAGENTGGNANSHNKAFRKLAARFCKVHGCLDLKAFY